VHRRRGLGPLFSSTCVQGYRSSTLVQGYRSSTLVQGVRCITEVHLLYRDTEIVQ